MIKNKMSTQEKIRWWEKGNPYEVVREESTEKVCYFGRRVTTIGFDAKDRKVMQRTEVFTPMALTEYCIVSLKPMAIGVVVLVNTMLMVIISEAAWRCQKSLMKMKIEPMFEIVESCVLGMI